jgi:hypothetical protein
VKTTSLHRWRPAPWLGLACCGLALAQGTPAKAEQRWETLEAIHWVENPHDTAKPGPLGELGAYQFREVTWQMHTHKPFHCALDRAQSDAVAVMHYEWIKHGLKRAGMPATVYNIALAWNGGLRATIRGQAPPAAHDYAERVANLAGTLAADRMATNR